MSIRPNTTCAIYRTGNAPPAAPDVAAVPCCFITCFDLGREHGEKESLQYRFTARMLVAPGTDVRDAFNAWTGSAANRDTVYIPNQIGIGYNVNFVERINQGLAGDALCVYLDRLAVNWPFPGEGGPGALVNPAMTMTGTGTIGVAAAGALTNPAMTVSGTAAISISGSGALTNPAMTISGTGTDSSGGSGPSLNQSVGSGNAGSPTTTVTWGTATQSGNLLIVGFKLATDAAVATPTNWTLANHFTTGSGPTQKGVWIFSTTSVGSISSQNFTVTGVGDWLSMEWNLGSGDLAIVGTVDQTANNSGTGESADSGTTSTTSQASELAIAMIGAFTSTLSSPTNGFTGTEYGSAMIASLVLTSTGTPDCGATVASSVAWIGCIATFK